MATADQYTAFLQNLLPQGVAWTREQTATITRLLAGIATELARLDGRALDLIRESDPRQSSELLTDWERITGLPDGCSNSLDIIQARRDAVASRLAALGGQSITYFTKLAATVGFAITVTEFKPFQTGVSEVGDPLSNGPWRHAWRVNAPETTIRPFRVGQSNVGEPLAVWGNDLLECTISRVKPAHSVLQFGYGG